MFSENFLDLKMGLGLTCGNHMLVFLLKGLLFMTKTEIIQSVAYANCAPGSRLVERNIPGSEFTVACITPKNVAGLEIVASRILAEQLVVDTEDLPETPSQKLFERLHNTCLQIHEGMIDDALFEAMEDDTRDTHREMIVRLREMAHKLGIQYEEPDDPLLNPPEPPKIDGGE